MRWLWILSAVLLFSCGETVGEQTLQVEARGLWLTPNPLAAPAGALSTADNAVIRRPGVVEPRRGQKPDLDAGSNIDAITAFEGGVVFHQANGVLNQRVSAGVDAPFTGTYTAPTGYPMRFAEAGGGLYFTTNAGPYRLDSLSVDPVPAGTPPGLEGSGTTTGASGWLDNNHVVGYRFVWGSRDSDGALLLGAPSGRILVTNGSGGSRDVLLTIPIPDGITANVHFVQVYRTVIEATSSADDPGEDMALVAEVFPTASQLTAGSMTVTDISSFANGAAAYFSPSVGQGTLEAKEQPPLFTDAINFKGYVFGVVQAYRYYVNLTLLGVGGATTLALGDGLKIDAADGSWSEGFIASAAPEGTQLVGPPPIAAWAFTLSTGGTAAQNIEATARSLVRVVNTRAPHLYAQYVSGPGDLPGKIIISMRDLGGSAPYVRATVNGETWVPALRVFQDVSLNRVANVVTATTAGAHHVTTGQVIHITSTDANFATGDYTVASTPSTTTFTYAETGINAAALGQEFNTTTEDVTMNQDAVPGSWAHSAFQEPDAWPPRFRYQVGGPNTVLYRITAQGEALLFWTSDGLYRLTGNDDNDFTLRPLDPTIQLVGQSTPATLGNRAFALTSQGVVSVTELGVEKVSTPIDLALLPYYASTDTFREVTDEAAFGIAYQSENEYMLFLPTSNGPAPGDLPVQAYVFNTQTGTWVRHEWEWASINAGTFEVATGVVNPSDNYLYLTSGSWLTRERKDRALSDYQDADNAGIPVDVAYQVSTAKNPGALKQWTEVACLLESPQPSAVELYFATELDSAEEGGTINSQSNVAVRTYVPRNKSRSARLTVGLRHSTAQQKPTILGLSVVYNTSSTRVGR